MTDDTGFAPNPFHGILTLATCKPNIRSSKTPGEYIAGFTSKALCGDQVGEERLIFIMNVTDKMDFDSYFNHPNFQCKKPSSESWVTKSGDNIYYKGGNEYKRSRNFRHLNEESFQSDLKSDQVLISSEFFYFGAGAIPVDRFRIRIPKGQSAHGSKTTDEKLVADLWNYLIKNYQKNIVLNPPHHWEEGEVFN